MVVLNGSMSCFLLMVVVYSVRLLIDRLWLVMVVVMFCLSMLNICLCVMFRFRL